MFNVEKILGIPHSSLLIEGGLQHSVDLLACLAQPGNQGAERKVEGCRAFAASRSNAGLDMVADCMTVNFFSSISVAYFGWVEVDFVLIHGPLTGHVATEKCDLSLYGFKLS